jgi:hypothetical protein
MYYCNKCNKDLQLSQLSMQSYGVCELCGAASDSYLLPKQPICMKTLLVIAPGNDEYRRDCIFDLLVAETGEHLASHVCSNYRYAHHDLYQGRPERIEEWSKRFGEIEVKFINETDITEEELLRRNKEWFAGIEESSKG